jgi:hypothetical protein
VIATIAGAYRFKLQGSSLFIGIKSILVYKVYSPSQSDAKPSAADAEPTTHENEEHEEEESQEGGGQTDAEGNKETLV